MRSIYLLSIIIFVSQAKASHLWWDSGKFPDRADYLMQRDPDVSDTDLLEGRTEIKPFRCLEENYATSCLDYSTLSKMSLEKLKELIMNIENYKRSFSEAGVTKSELLKHSSEKDNMLMARIQFKLGGAGIEIPYIMDAELFPKYEPGTWFGYRYRQDEKLQEEEVFTVTERQSGAWYIEKFGAEADLWYVRLRAAVELTFPMPESRYYRYVTKRTKQTLKIVGKYPPFKEEE